MGSLRLFQAARIAGVRACLHLNLRVHEVILGDRPLTRRIRCGPAATTCPSGAGEFVHNFDSRWPYGRCRRPTGIYGTAHPPGSRWPTSSAQVIRGELIRSPKGGKEVHALTSRAVEVLLKRTRSIAGQAFNCYDRYIAEEEVAHRQGVERE